MVAEADTGRVQAAWSVLASVLDPEVPVLSVLDLGLVREVAVGERGALRVVLTPTYSGCPAVEVIEAEVRQALHDAGLGPVTIETRRAPAWTTDWITPDGLRKLHDYGIAPPGQGAAQVLRLHSRDVACPRCGAARTERLSAFGATACKALYRCLACREPFEHFKPI